MVQWYITVIALRSNSLAVMKTVEGELQISSTSNVLYETRNTLSGLLNQSLLLMVVFSLN